MKARGERYAAMGLLFALISTNALAQDANSLLNEANFQIRSIGGIAFQVIISVLGIIAIVSLVQIAISLHKSDTEATNKALGWCGGTVFCIIAAVVIKNFLGI